MSASYSFAGWIPTISGHLSFSVIGTHKSGPGLSTFNKFNEKAQVRQIVVHQKRTVQDYIYPDSLVKFFKPESTQDYIFVSQTTAALTPHFKGDGLETVEDNMGALEGTVYIVPQETAQPKKEHREKFINDLCSNIENRAENELTAKKIADVVKTATTYGVRILSVKFKLFRTGEVRLWFEMDGFLGRKTHTQAIPPNDGEQTLAEFLPSQVYYFMKDIAHLHYHHKPQSDQILTLSPTNSPNHDENEARWRRETLWGLARVIAQFRRENRLYHYKKAQGILAYADAFQSTLARVHRGRNTNDPLTDKIKLSPYDFAHTRISLEAMESIAFWRRSGMIQTVATAVAVFLASVALWSGAFKAAEKVCALNGKVACPIEVTARSQAVLLFVLSHPLLFFAINTVAVIVAIQIFVQDAKFLPFSQKLSLLLSRISKSIGASTIRTFSYPWAGYIVTLLIQISVALTLIAGAAWLAWLASTQ